MMTQRLNSVLSVTIEQDGTVTSHNGRGHVDVHGRIPLWRVDQLFHMQNDPLINNALIREEFRDAMYTAQDRSGWFSRVFWVVVAILAATLAIVAFSDVAAEVARPSFEICKTRGC